MSLRRVLNGTGAPAAGGSFTIGDREARLVAAHM